ncbi:MAG: hypothetical protein ACHQNT_07895, partial [Bacteroidia bacterium]
MKSKINILLLSMALCVVSITNSFAQVVTLIDPAGDGGFESGPTFAANGWTVAAGVATNQWFVGNGAVPHTGSNCAYISENAIGSTYTYNFTSPSTVYFYRDVTFPVGKPRISLTINWQIGGEFSTDRGFVCYTDPANTPVVNDFMSTTPPQYATAVPNPLGFNGWQNTGGIWSVSTTYLLPSSFEGTTRRIIFGWQNNNGGNSLNPPAAFDNIELTAGPNITCTPDVNGGLWSDPFSWTSKLYPGPGDDVLIPDGRSITVDGSQIVKNITVGQGSSGIVNFIGSAFNNLTVTGNLTVNSGGQFNGFTQTASPTGGGIQLNVAGNINLNAGGIMTMGHTSTILNMNGTSPQSINGPGVFLGGLVRVLTIANPSSVTLNTPVTLTEGLRHYAGTLNTNGNLTLDNTAQSYGNAFNQQVYAAVVPNMGTNYLSQPTVTCGIPWSAGLQVVLGSVILSGGNTYAVTTAGVLGLTAPTNSTTLTQANGTAFLCLMGTEATATANWDATSKKVRSITINT